MGIYINKGNKGFQSAIKSEYVDKTGMIAIINKTLDSEKRYTCATRCRRFGKTMAADMLCAYYDKSCDSHQLFDGLYISQPDKFVNGKLEDKQYEKHLNKYPVISLDITDFITKYRDQKEIITYIQEDIISDLLSLYPDIKPGKRDDLMDILIKIVNLTGERFIMIIDEWDAICREYDKTPEVMDKYIDLLRRLFKSSNSKNTFIGVYMTGILPIKRYNTESALNNFWEYSVISPGELDSYFGFTADDVKKLADGRKPDAEELKDWYDGYSIGNVSSIYNPFSVMVAINHGVCENNWSKTGALDSIIQYINMNFDGLKDNIIYMLSGGYCKVDTTGFDNDPSKFKNKDDILTILIHLGYLAYDNNSSQCYIPNKEVAKEMEKAVRACNWEHVNKALKASEFLLNATLEMKESIVAQGIELTHDEHTSILAYNDENSLACVLSIAYYFARNNYIIYRELATGKGFADLVLIPRRNVNSPALIIELKCNKDTETAIDQIKNKNYPAKITEYTGDILLVGINYNKKSKKHTCKIERWALP